MRLRTRPLVARGAALLVLLVYVAGISANGWLERRLGLQSEHPAEDVVLFVGFSLFAAVGALLVAKRPDNPIGWIMSANALIVGIFPACESYAAYVMSTSGHPDALAVLASGLTPGTGTCSSRLPSSTCPSSSPMGACPRAAGYPSPWYLRSGSQA